MPLVAWVSSRMLGLGAATCLTDTEPKTELDVNTMTVPKPKLHAAILISTSRET